MDRYTLVTVSGIHTQIAKTTKTKGYTVGVMEVFLPTEEELEKWSDKQTTQWIGLSKTMHG